MPTYIYKCETHKGTLQVQHGMTEDPIVACPLCNKPMHRVPQAFHVNWNGPPPHVEQSHIIKDFVNTADERRDKYLQEKEGNNA